MKSGAQSFGIGNRKLKKSCLLLLATTAATLPKLKEPRFRAPWAAAKARFEGIGLLPEGVLLGAFRAHAAQRKKGLSGRAPDPVEADKHRRPTPSAHQPPQQKESLEPPSPKAQSQLRDARRQWERGVVEVDYVVVLAICCRHSPVRRNTSPQIFSAECRCHSRKSPNHDQSPHCWMLLAQVWLSIRNAWTRVALSAMGVANMACIFASFLP